MSEKISEYTTSVTALASGDLMDVSKLISTSPDVYQSQKLNYSVLLTELNADLSITLQSAYNASTQPQILTSVAKGGVVIRSGQSLDTNSVLELKNIAGSSTFVVGGNGIVATGNWQATAIAAAFGGTGQTSYTIGDIIYASNTTAISKLGIGTSGQVLTVSGGGIPSWATVSAPNLGSANLTSADDARTFTLKSGGTATQNLAFLNDGGGNLLRLRGDNKISMLTSGGTFDINIGDVSNTKTIYGFGSFYMTSASAAYETYLIGTGNVGVNRLSNGAYARFDGSAGDPYLNQKGGTYVILSYDSSNNNIHWLDNRGLYRMMDSSGIVKVELGSQSSFNNFLARDTKIGGVHTTASAKLEVQGSGATAATTTALFQNSASVSTLKVKDDGYCILKANNAAIASGDLANNEMSFYIDEATNHCVVKVKYSSGTVKTGTFNLT